MKHRSKSDARILETYINRTRLIKFEVLRVEEINEWLDQVLFLLRVSLLSLRRIILIVGFP